MPANNSTQKICASASQLHASIKTSLVLPIWILAHKGQYIYEVRVLFHALRIHTTLSEELLLFFLLPFILSFLLVSSSSMALAKERMLEGSQTCSLYGNVHGGGPSIQGLDPSLLELFSYKGHNDVLLEDGGGSESFRSYSGDPSNSSSGSFVFGSVEAGSNHWAYSGSSVLSFEQGDRVLCTNYPNIDHEDESAIWMDAMDQNYQPNNFDMKCGNNSCLIEDQCLDLGSGYKLMSNAMNENRQNKKQFGLLYLDAAAGDGHQESVEQEKGIQKCPYMGGELQASKKHRCSTRKTKAKPGPSKDPQSIAARNRRERIGERLKILQDLIPNGSKVDLVTMLEKAISYVKFLQLQVKVLATDEFWPAQGGKAPEVSQVKEAIDAILSSHRNSKSIS